MHGRYHIVINNLSQTCLEIIGRTHIILVHTYVNCALVLFHEKKKDCFNFRFSIDTKVITRDRAII